MEKRQKRTLLIACVVFILILSVVISGPIRRISESEEVGRLDPGSAGSGCQQCHQITHSEGDPHGPFDCMVCHLGDASSADAEVAHVGLVRIPGNLADANRTCAVCHDQEVADVHHSLMTTNTGIVGVDRFVFGEQLTPDGTTAISDIGHSPADDHLRNLCASCHLGNEKLDFGGIDDASRGGGCNACHLNYGSEAKEALQQYLQDATALPMTHPTLDLQIGDTHCLGCHSRSGRISMNYQGYHETQLTALPQGPLAANRHRQLQDGRVFEYVAEDVHHQAGLLCVDCHSYVDTMGDGKYYAHKEDAVKIRCEDCHANHRPEGVELTTIPAHYQRIHKARGYSHTRMLATEKEAIPLVNTYLPGDGTAHLFGKLDRVLHALIPPTQACNLELSHKNLSCSACHTAWAPQCVSCHTRYREDEPGYDLLENAERIGSWVEQGGDFRAEAPALGVFVSETEAKQEKNLIQPAIPGMIMSLEKEGFPTLASGQSQRSFHRLFAPAAPHTISKVGRDCRSCHNNPIALGYGAGELVFSKEPDGPNGGWTFEPLAESLLLEDGLPVDAWIGFLKTTQGNASTRSHFRPFTIDEQKRILRVGACLECHDQKSERMLNTLQVQFSELLDRLPDACIDPFVD